MVAISPKLYIEAILAGPKAGGTSYRPDMVCVDKPKLIAELKDIFNQLNISRDTLLKNPDRASTALANYIGMGNPRDRTIRVCKKVFIPFAKENVDLIFPKTVQDQTASPASIPVTNHGSTIEILVTRRIHI